MADGVSNPVNSASPSRARHQFTRSITEISLPVKLHRHHNHFHHQFRDHGDSNTSAPLSATSTLQPRASVDRAHSRRVTPDISPDPSRRTSVLGADEDLALGKTLIDKDGDLKRQRAEAQIASLKRSLIDLNQTSVTTAERLDGLYRSVQQKAAVLQSTVTALWELAGMSQDVKQTFNRETRELVSDVEEQLDTFGSFEEQQRTIGQLQERILLGRRRITVLSDRIDGVQDKIERWERADREWQERTRKRLKVIWIITSILVFVIISLVLIVQYWGPTIEEATVKFANESLSMLRNHSILLHKPEWGTGEIDSSAPFRQPNLTIGARDERGELDLRIFDEL